MKGNDMPCEQVRIFTPEPELYNAFLAIARRHGREQFSGKDWKPYTKESLIQAYDGTIHPRYTLDDEPAYRVITDINEAVAALTAPMTPPEPPFTLFGHEVEFRKSGEVAVGCQRFMPSWLESVEQQWNRQPEREAVYVETPCEELFFAVRNMLERISFPGLNLIDNECRRYIGFKGNGCTGSTKSDTYYSSNNRRRITLEELPAYLESKPVAKPYQEFIDGKMLTVYPGDRITWNGLTETAEKVNDFLKRWKASKK